MNRQSRRIGRCASVLWSPAVLLFISCASVPEPPSPTPIAKSLLGKSEKQILECAGKPFEQTRYGQGVILRYFKARPMLEESQLSLEGLLAGGQHYHGCWARLVIEKDEVIGVDYRTVPEGAEKADDKCDEIFRQCAP